MEREGRDRIRGVHSIVQQAAETSRRKPTEAEYALWNALRDRRLEGWKFRRQHPMGKFILDFYLAEYRLCVEVDGDIHDASIERDAERSAFLQACDCRVLRLRNEEILNDLPNALERIRQAVRTILAEKADQKAP